MVDGDGSNQEAVRAPTKEDLVRVCRDLNERNAKYIVIGGMALIELGLDRWYKLSASIERRGVEGNRRSPYSVCFC